VCLRDRSLEVLKISYALQNYYICHVILVAVQPTYFTIVILIFRIIQLNIY
jgi:hypothetical protein